MKTHQLIHQNSSSEWITPRKIIETARSAMGRIDLDPASSESANKVVRARSYYSVENDGLSQQWTGRIWCNPPYGRIGNKSSQSIWVDKAIAEYENGHAEQIIMLVNASTETLWFGKLWRFSICFVHGRISFLSPDGAVKRAPTHGNAIVCIGGDEDTFFREFSPHGVVVS